MKTVTLLGGFREVTGLGWMRSGDGRLGLAQTSFSGEWLRGTRHAMLEGKTSIVSKVRLKSVQKLRVLPARCLPAQLLNQEQQGYSLGKKNRCHGSWRRGGGCHWKKAKSNLQTFLSVKVTFWSLGGTHSWANLSPCSYNEQQPRLCTSTLSELQHQWPHSQGWELTFLKILIGFQWAQFHDLTTQSPAQHWRRGMVVRPGGRGERGDGNVDLGINCAWSCIPMPRIYQLPSSNNEV